MKKDGEIPAYLSEKRNKDMNSGWGGRKRMYPNFQISSRVKYQIKIYRES